MECRGSSPPRGSSFFLGKVMPWLCCGALLVCLFDLACVFLSSFFISLIYSCTCRWWWMTRRCGTVHDCMIIVPHTYMYMYSIHVLYTYLQYMYMHTTSLSLSLPLSLSLSPSLSLSLSLSLSHTHILPSCLTHTLPFCLTHTLSHSLIDEH